MRKRIEFSGEYLLNSLSKRTINKMKIALRQRLNIKRCRPGLSLSCKSTAVLKRPPVDE